MKNAGYLNAGNADNGEVYRGRIATMEFAKNVPKHIHLQEGKHEPLISYET